MRNTSRFSLLVLTVSFGFVHAGASAQTVSGVSGSVANGQTISISGSNFGSSGPKIVIYDDFENGPVGQNIANHPATIGAWDNMVDSSPPHYDSTYRLSGNQSMKSDFRIASGSSVQATISPAESDAFLSFWVYLPTTSEFPGADGRDGPPNWKLTWLMRSCCSTTDLMVPISITAGPPAQNFYISCNDCTGDVYFGNDAGTKDLLADKGKWYRVWAYIHGANDSSGERDVSFLSRDANIPVTAGLAHKGAVFSSSGPYFSMWLFGAYGRLSSQESSPRYDDVYLAVGPNARARVEIGDASTYAACKNLTNATVTSWSSTSINAVVRQGAFTSLDQTYLYVTDAAGRVSNGLLLSSGGALKPTPPSNLRIIKAALNLSGLVGGVAIVVARRRAMQRRG